MAVRRAETPAGMREHYRCMGRRSGAVDCKQPDVPRQAIDSAVMEYFATVALDVEGTVAQLTGERDRRLAELDERLAWARKRERDADAERSWPGATRCCAKDWRWTSGSASSLRRRRTRSRPRLTSMRCWPNVSRSRPRTTLLTPLASSSSASPHSAQPSPVTSPQPSHCGRRRWRSAGCSTGSSCTALTHRTHLAAWTPSWASA
jgi:hypothetical protein